MIPLSVPSLKGNELKYVRECLDTEWVSSAGTYVERFESDLASFVHAPHAVACVNGTAALHVALVILGVRPGEEVLVPTLTFIATINAVRYVGAEPVFMDSDDFYNVDVDKIMEFLAKETKFRNGNTYNRTTGKRIAAIVPVHVFGNAVMLHRLIDTCHGRNIRILEDATESLGAYYLNPELQGRYTGTVGDIGCFSFNGNKIITTGGGGMLVTSRAEYAEKARYLTTQAKDDEVRYIHNEIGFNFRLTNIQAAIGVAQLECLQDFLDVKRRIYAAYKDKVCSIEGISVADVPAYAKNNHWMVALQINISRYGKNCEELMGFLKEHGIQTRPVWYLNHLQVPYRTCQSYRIEKAITLHEKTLCVPCSVNLTEGDIDRVISNLRHG